MSDVDDAIERAERTEHWRSLAIDSARQTHSDRAILAAEVQRLRGLVADSWDEGYRACLRQWDHPANADRMPERNPHTARWYW